MQGQGLMFLGGPIELRYFMHSRTSHNEFDSTSESYRSYQSLTIQRLHLGAYVLFSAFLLNLCFADCMT